MTSVLKKTEFTLWFSPSRRALPSNPSSTLIPGSQPPTASLATQLKYTQKQLTRLEHKYDALVRSTATSTAKHEKDQNAWRSFKKAVGLVTSRNDAFREEFAQAEERFRREGREDEEEEEAVVRSQTSKESSLATTPTRGKRKRAEQVARSTGSVSDNIAPGSARKKPLSSITRYHLAAQPKTPEPARPDLKKGSLHGHPLQSSSNISPRHADAKERNTIPSSEASYEEKVRLAEIDARHPQFEQLTPLLYGRSENDRSEKWEDTDELTKDAPYALRYSQMQERNGSPSKMGGLPQTAQYGSSRTLPPTTNTSRQILDSTSMPQASASSYDEDVVGEYMSRQPPRFMGRKRKHSLNCKEVEEKQKRDAAFAMKTERVLRQEEERAWQPHHVKAQAQLASSRPIVQEAGQYGEDDDEATEHTPSSPSAASAFSFRHTASNATVIQAPHADVFSYDSPYRSNKILKSRLYRLLSDSPETAKSSRDAVQPDSLTEMDFTMSAHQPRISKQHSDSFESTQGPDAALSPPLPVRIEQAASLAFKTAYMRSKVYNADDYPPKTLSEEKLSIRSKPASLASPCAVPPSDSAVTTLLKELKTRSSNLARKVALKDSAIANQSIESTWRDSRKKKRKRIKSLDSDLSCAPATTEDPLARSKKDAWAQESSKSLHSHGKAGAPVIVKRTSPTPSDAQKKSRLNKLEMPGEMVVVKQSASRSFSPLVAPAPQNENNHKAAGDAVPCKKDTGSKMRMGAKLPDDIQADLDTVGSAILRHADMTPAATFFALDGKNASGSSTALRKKKRVDIERALQAVQKKRDLQSRALQRARPVTANSKPSPIDNMKRTHNEVDANGIPTSHSAILQLNDVKKEDSVESGDICRPSLREKSDMKPSLAHPPSSEEHPGERFLRDIHKQRKVEMRKDPLKNKGRGAYARQLVA